MRLRRGGSQMPSISRPIRAETFRPVGNFTCYLGYILKGGRTRVPL